MRTGLTAAALVALSLSGSRAADEARQELVVQEHSDNDHKHVIGFNDKRLGPND